MKGRKEKSDVPILAAGGIVLRNHRGRTPQFAVVQSRKLATWGLPKGKLAAGEDAVTAARREVLEETGHDVTVHEFLGTLVYETASRPKIIHFWRMEAESEPTFALMRDVMAVDWLALKDAVDRLSHMRERVFLEQVGPIALTRARKPAPPAPFLEDAVTPYLAPGVPLAPVAADAILSDHRGGAEAVANQIRLSTSGQGSVARLAGPEMAGPKARRQARDTKKTGSAQRLEHLAAKILFTKILVARIALARTLVTKALAGKRLVKNTWGWIRHAAPFHQQRLD